MAFTASILIYGRNPTLLDTRRWVLESAGFQVTTVTAMAAVMKAITAKSLDLLVLCHTLTAEERRAAIATAAAVQPVIKTLSICTDRQTVGDEEVSRENLDSLAGAKGLIAAARKTLG